MDGRHLEGVTRPGTESGLRVAPPADPIGSAAFVGWGWGEPAERGAVVRMPGRVLVGTSSWTDPSLIASGLFYPPEARTAEARLRFYASKFGVVEVDSSYYSLPSRRTSELWAARTPPGFIFDVKAFALLTNHPVEFERLPPDLREEARAAAGGRERVYMRDLPPSLVLEVRRRFLEALEPLEGSGKLGAVFFQFPPWFLPGRPAYSYLEELAELGVRVAVEFRNARWLEGRQAQLTLELLKSLDLPLVCVDMPQGFPSSLPPVAEVTSEHLAVVRFHGRNREAWGRKGVGVQERFRYLYSEEELEEWVPRVQGLASRAREVHVLFNNCYRNYAQSNASQFLSLLTREEPGETGSAGASASPEGRR